ncbi:MAG: ATP-binding protein [Nitrososphaerales archaeon]
MIEDYEKLGVFYIGKKYNLESRKREESSLVLYDSKDLLTHAVCLGMTGSGKTGLCTVLLEEAIIDGIPLIIIDPKGDIPNLLLNFPQLTGENFLPWINEEDARKKGFTLDEYAHRQAETWRNGLTEWGQQEERILRLRNAANFVIYTPGSNAGIPISILKSFAVPPKEIVQDSELFRETITNTVNSLLTLAGIQANPLEDREHILISTILDKLWKEGKDLDLAGLINAVQNPPMNKVGVLDIESFFPSNDRFNLVMSLNNLVASPSFSSWMEGADLDIEKMLYDKRGKPNVSIFSISHLNDNERMFFVTLLLNQILYWVRSQPGTSSLRTILYMDEIFGYLPPVANPPSKQPFITLLKQARAFGLGLLLATQNPVDLDYKGLSNIGTWFIGRLQTDRDKARLLDGLEGSSQNGNKEFERKKIEQIISSLENRVFLMSNAHEDGLEIFQTRWALSYLRGPLTRDQIKKLMVQVKALPDFLTNGTKSDVKEIVSKNMINKDQISDNNIVNHDRKQPTLHPEITQYFIPVSNVGTKNKLSEFYYRPVILGAASLNFVNSKLGIDTIKDLTVITPIVEDPISVDWGNSQEIDIDIKNLQQKPEGENFTELPSIASKPEKYDIWKKEFIDWLYRNQKLSLFKFKNSKEVSKLGESEGNFRNRIRTLMRENRDNTVEKLRQKYAPKIRNLQDKIQRAQYGVEIQQEQANQQKMHTAISFGSTLIGAFMGRKVSRYSSDNASRVMRGIARTRKEKKDIERAIQTRESYEQQLIDVENEFKAEIAELDYKIKNNIEELETITIKVDKKDISVRLVSLTWIPTFDNTV